jgi:hypothetical protein
MRSGTGSNEELDEVSEIDRDALHGRGTRTGRFLYGPNRGPALRAPTGSFLGLVESSSEIRLLTGFTLYQNVHVADEDVANVTVTTLGLYTNGIEAVFDE